MAASLEGLECGMALYGRAAGLTSRAFKPSSDSMINPAPKESHHRIQYC